LQLLDLATLDQGRIEAGVASSKVARLSVFVDGRWCGGGVLVAAEIKLKQVLINAVKISLPWLPRRQLTKRAAQSGCLRPCASLQRRAPSMALASDDDRQNNANKIKTQRRTRGGLSPFTGLSAQGHTGRHSCEHTHGD